MNNKLNIRHILAIIGIAGMVWAAVSCKQSNPEVAEVDDWFKSYHIDKIEIRGQYHELLRRSNSYGNFIHSPSCPCLHNQKDSVTQTNNQ